MKLGTLRVGGRDGTLVVVRRDNRVYAPATGIAPTLQHALDDWDRLSPPLHQLAAQLETGATAGQPVTPDAFAAPLPRAYEWLDGSAYLSHVECARRARGAPIPDDLTTVPLVYQGGSGALAGGHDPVPLDNPQWGLDFEAELAVILADVPAGADHQTAAQTIRLVCLANDWTLRNLVPGELARGFGFVQSKPPTAFAPFAVTPDELGPAWRDGRIHLPIEVQMNGHPVGLCDAGEMHFSFVDLLVHVARTRRLTAGTVLGSGTVSNRDPDRGVCCLVERRALETLANGTPQTPYLKHGDTVTIRIKDDHTGDLCGTISQTVTATNTMTADRTTPTNGTAP